MNRPSTAISGTAPRFHGRNEELDWLSGLLDDVAGTRVPRLAVILAESGLGKTALVQALYRKLTTDTRWDGPSPGGFWPDAFQGSDDDLKVNPDFPESYQPGEPPKYMWLGIRWQNPGNRNRDDQVCPLPEARNVLNRHVEVVEGLHELWKRFRARLGKRGANLREELAEEGVTIVVEELTKLGLGPLSPFARFLIAAGREAIQGKGVRHHDLKEKTVRDAGDELCRDLGWLMAGEEPLPTILWLDDAQWIDASSIAFLDTLFRQAKSRKWPLLVIATHWEREWSEHLQRGSNGTPRLTRFADWEFGENRKTEVRVLDKGGRESLRSLLLDPYRLPGLTLDQQDLLIEKSDGNFLTLVENIGELLGRKRNFEDRDRTHPITRAAMERIEGWESERDKRVEQRFQTLEEEIQDILGWSSRAGTRFVMKMVVDFAQGRIENDPEGQISMCFDPFAILSGSGDRCVVEFRDRAYHRSAMKYFEEFLRGSDDDDLQSFIKKWFSDWVNRCFDDDGETLSPESAPEFSLLTTSPAERVELLEMIVESLTLRDEPDWSGERDAAALRARCMLVEACSKARLWDQCRKVAQSLEKVDWVAAPTTVLGFVRREDTCSHLVNAGALVAASRVATSLLETGRGVAEELGTPESRLVVTRALNLLGTIEESSGELDRAYELFSQALEISRGVAEELGTPESRQDVFVSLDRLGGIKMTLDKLDEAQELFSEALEVGRGLAAELGTPESRRDVSVPLVRLGDVKMRLGKLDRAYELFSEALEIGRGLAAELGTSESQRDVSIPLERLGNIKMTLGKLDEAHELFSETLEIRRRLTKELDTPQSRGDVSVSLTRLGHIEESSDKLDRAYELFSEALEICRQLAEALDTPLSRERLAAALYSLGGIREKLWEMEMKPEFRDEAHELFSEALEIRRRLAKELDTPQSLWDFAISLYRLGQTEMDCDEFDVDVLGDLAGELNEANKQSAIEGRRRIAEELDTPGSLQYLCVALEHFGQTEMDCDELENAYELAAEAMEIRLRLVQELGTPESLWDLSVAQELLGDIEARRGDPDETNKQSALGIRRQLAEMFGTPGSRQEVSKRS